MKITGVVVSAFMFLVVLFSSWVNIPQGQVGIVFDKSRGGVLPKELGQGWHFKTPLIQWVQEYPVALFLICALSLPPSHMAIVQEFSAFMWHNPGWEYHIQFEKPPEARGWTRLPYLWKSYRVFIRRAA